MVYDVNHTRGIQQKRKRDGNPRAVVAAKVSTADAEAVAAAAEAAGVTRSRWIAEALQRALREPAVAALTVPSTTGSGVASVSVEAQKAA